MLPLAPSQWLSELCGERARPFLVLILLLSPHGLVVFGGDFCFVYLALASFGILFFFFTLLSVGLARLLVLPYPVLTLLCFIPLSLSTFVFNALKSLSCSGDASSICIWAFAHL